MFDEFWKAYPSECPRKSGKSKCLKKYLSLLKAAKEPNALHNAILVGEVGLPPRLKGFCDRARKVATLRP